MENTIITKYRSAGTPGKPSTGSLAEGELAVNLGGDTAGDTQPSLYVGDANGDPVSIVTEALFGGGAFLPLSGGAFDTGAAITMQPTVDGDTVIDASNGAIDNAVIDGGTF